ncbi:WD repeat protein [Talaromyces stipitatus ATCC 10500]|uniref:WD repeat protein n=1 Tax=Talaromyces stipitatus (strain ATCC 10500 / CBS 375.48 / QM 6759 / NRRL 1006) TaxID=441959 RepID=B8MTW1_TALSN|nr:WD repeat protein [Talaromyces stipitatus ATCC 10500]EED12575.1 WD repeat protein [Talaromyces stipitatus ATCC 10500]
MLPSGRTVKRQRPTDASQDAKVSRSKRLKTTSEEVLHKGNAAVASSDKKKKSSDWSLELMFRGNIFNIDPVFSVDEKYLFFSRGDAVQVYSMATQRPVKTLTMKDSSHVTGLHLVPSDPQHLYISTLSGRLIQWDWDTGRETINRANFAKVSLFGIVPLKVQDEQKERLAYFAVKSKGSRHHIVVNTEWAQRKDSADNVVLDTANTINHFKVVQGGQFIVACARQQLIIGTLSPKSKEKGHYNDYEWREYRIPVKQITCLDVRETQTGVSGEKSTASIDIAVGDASGVILVYNDVLGSISREGASGLPLLQRLHWHREAVASLRWSQDGNYIISGGKESVIVFWQLDSGRRNFLPHLSSPIRSITISSVGALYAVQLADRSITVISATELNSVATIDGLHLPSTFDAIVDTKDRGVARSERLPAILHPLQPERLLLASPGGDSVNLTFLQTFNIQTGLNISRQALARTNVTILNRGPEGTPIQPPNVEFMDLSVNGQWLATVDSWSPPRQDVEASVGPLLPEDPQLQRRTEIFLKFWHWSETQGIWELATRVESPHLAPSGEALQILSLKARSDRPEFVTLGTDLLVKVWQPTARYTISTKSQPRSNSMEHTWKNLTSMDLSYVGCDASAGAMVFSEDGSILAVGIKNTVHLIDTRQWTVYCSRQVFPIDSVRSVEFQGRFLVVLSEQSLAVWNVVDDVVQTPAKSALTSSGSSKHIALAADSSSDTFAVVTRAKGANLPGQSSRKSTYNIAVYKTSTMTLLSESELEKPPIKFLADANNGGYIAIDAAANLWRFSHPSRNTQALTVSTEASVQHAAAGAGLDSIFGRAGQKTLEQTRQQQPITPTLKSENLGGIFDRAPPFALPPATALFKDVINALVSSS